MSEALEKINMGRLQRTMKIEVFSGRLTVTSKCGLAEPNETNANSKSNKVTVKVDFIFDLGFVVVVVIMIVL